MSGASSTMMLLRMGFSLALILGMIWFAARMLRRKGKLSGASSTDLELVSRRSMGRRSNLVVVRVAGRTLLVGSTDTTVSLVADISNGDLTDSHTTDSHTTDSHTTDSDATDRVDLTKVTAVTEPVATVHTIDLVERLASRAEPIDLLETLRKRTVRRA